LITGPAPASGTGGPGNIPADDGEQHRRLQQQARATLAASPAPGLLEHLQAIHRIVLAAEPAALRRSVGWLGRLLGRDITLQVEANALRSELGVHVLQARQQLGRLAEHDQQLEALGVALRAAIEELDRQSSRLVGQPPTDEQQRGLHHLATLSTSLSTTASHLGLMVIHHRQLTQRARRILPHVEMLLDQQRMLRAGLSAQAALQAAMVRSIPCRTLHRMRRAELHRFHSLPTIPRPDEDAPMTDPTPNDHPAPISPALSDAALRDLGLSTADIEQVMEAARALQDLSPGNLHSYGREAAGRTTTFSTQLLEKVRNADLDSSGEKLGEVVRIARSLKLAGLNERSSVPIIGPLLDRMKAGKGELVQRYSTTNQQIDQLMIDVGNTQSTQQQRVREYDQMHEIVREERHQLGIHIAAGRVRIGELQQELEALRGQDDPDSRVRRAELDNALRLIDKRVSDLQVLQQVAEQTLPMIRLIQANAIQLIEKFSAVRDVTIPMWRNQFAIQLSLADQRSAVELANAIDDASNELMRKNAEMVHAATVGAARANQRSIVDLETLRTVNETLISTVEEVRQIHRDGMAARRNLAAEIVAMRDDLQKRLAQATSDQTDVQETGS
jgi:uncharacterized protein YaaN involved in tellurite resistance